MVATKNTRKDGVFSFFFLWPLLSVKRSARSFLEVLAELRSCRSDSSRQNDAL